MNDAELVGESYGREDLVEESQRDGRIESVFSLQDCL